MGSLFDNTEILNQNQDIHDKIQEVGDILFKKINPKDIIMDFIIKNHFETYIERLDDIKLCLKHKNTRYTIIFDRVKEIIENINIITIIYDDNSKKVICIMNYPNRTEPFCCDYFQYSQKEIFIKNKTLEKSAIHYKF